MPKPKSLNPKVVSNVWLEPELRFKLDLQLFSELEGRVPHGAYSNFFNRILRQELEWAQLDLGAYGLPQGFFVKGPKEMIEQIRLKLEVE